MVQLMFASQSTQRSDSCMATQGASQLPEMMKDRCQLNPPLLLQLESDSEDLFRNITNAIVPLDPLLLQQPSANQPSSQYPTSQMQW